MKRCSGDWSITTAARALFMDARCDPNADKDNLMTEIKACWSVDPICTSIVVIFWQRYVCKLVQSINPSVRTQQPLHPCVLVLDCMPLKADRALPGELEKAMREQGWKYVSKLTDVPPPLPRPCSSASFASPRSRCPSASLVLPRTAPTRHITASKSRDQHLADEAPRDVPRAMGPRSMAAKPLPLDKEGPHSIEPEITVPHLPGSVDDLSVFPDLPHKWCGDEATVGENDGAQSYAMTPRVAAQPQLHSARWQLRY